MNQKTYFIKTFGCQMNDHDSAKIGLILSKLGYVFTEDDKKADLILINTCTIREKPQHKAMSEIGSALLLKKRFGPKLVGVCGCVAQQEGENLLRRFSGLDFVFGPDQISKLADIVSELENKTKILATELVNKQEDYSFIDLVPEKNACRVTAYVAIIKGCDNFCSYCIVPYVRGREVSRPYDEILIEVNNLVKAGVKEVTLLGQNVNSYSGCANTVDQRDPKLKLADAMYQCTSTLNFVDLVRGISKDTDIQRIRFMSPHPKDLSDELIKEYGNNPKLCRYIHLPVQAGSNHVLEMMNRKYTREHYLSLVSKLKAMEPNIAVTTDMIVGFPGETEDDFKETLDLVREVQFDNMFAFAYSPREGTKAAELKDNNPAAIKMKRLQELLNLQTGISKKKNEALIGKTFEVLVEGPDRMGTGRLMGRTSQNKIVNFTGQDKLIGTIVPVAIERANVNSLEGIVD